MLCTIRVLFAKITSRTTQVRLNRIRSPFTFVANGRSVQTRRGSMYSWREPITNPSSASCGWDGKRGGAWVMLDRFVFRRDGGVKPLPENETTAGSSTCIDVPFRVSLDLVPPPAASRINVEWPGGPKANSGRVCHLVAAHRGCILFRLTSIVRSKTSPQYLIFPDDYYIYRLAAADGSSPSLTRLPPSIRAKTDAIGEEPEPDRKSDLKSESESGSGSSESESGEIVVSKEVKWAEKVIKEAYERRLALGVDVDKEVVPSSLVMQNIGLCSDEASSVVVAELQLNKRKRKVSAELSLLHSDKCGCEWVYMSLPIQCNNHSSGDLHVFWTQATVPFSDHLCWVDYRRGIVLGQDMQKLSPNLSYIPFPRTSSSVHEHKLRSVCATDGGSKLKFIDVVVDKQPRSTGFTIVSYNLVLTEGHMKWEKETSMTSKELWGLQAPGRVPREVPLFPLVSLDKPQIVHLQFSECTDYIDTVTLVTIDMDAKEVISVLPHIKGEQELHGEDADVVEARTSLLQPFLPVTLSKPLLSRPVNFTRKRKDQG